MALDSGNFGLIFCYKIVFGMVNVSFSSFFKFRPVTNTSCINHTVFIARVVDFFAARVINVWNCLPPSVNYSTLARFRHSKGGPIYIVDFSSFLTCDID